MAITTATTISSVTGATTTTTKETTNTNNQPSNQNKDNNHNQNTNNKIDLNLVLLFFTQLIKKVQQQGLYEVKEDSNTCLFLIQNGL